MGKASNKILSSSKVDLLRDVSVVVGGKNSASIVDLLLGKNNVNEFIIAKKLGLTINQTRNILYKLSDEGLVSFIRKKDKKKGWYTYFWTFNEERAFLLLKKTLFNEITQLENQLKSREEKRYYICKQCNIEVTEETALLHDFVCPECGEVYELQDNNKSIKEINSSINRVKLKLKEVEDELEIIGSKNEKRIKKESAKAAKDKKAAKVKLSAKPNVAVKKVKKQPKIKKQKKHTKKTSKKSKAIKKK
ncbi:hypothetical protein COU56_05055 [Candidatus Pacearchaeota archaeon CG10_big_fil_rev_8_21_14_0_10_31_9]|nr:MAG: hypothetical protein COU56_05055 [Candidatus Pacearchaeota archaeon CG10_big_fil_rev_8_21_14_0_10_31_9]PIZ82920.1 MAG: hypothetical protein COX97_02270 [Candidatus Pacearchaeota archaeon CG_4_10_14_0_2_um_filter_05_32_18]